MMMMLLLLLLSLSLLSLWCYCRRRVAVAVVVGGGVFNLCLSRLSLLSFSLRGVFYARPSSSIALCSVYRCFTLFLLSAGLPEAEAFARHQI